MLELDVLRTYLEARLRIAQRRGERRGVRGASAIEWAIISAVVVTLALGIFYVVQEVVTSRSAEISRGAN